jgi:predicted RNase H-like nuclease
LTAARQVDFVAIGPGDELEFGIFVTIEKLWRTYSEAESMLIDIPIGLPSKEINTRLCDKAARILLSTSSMKEGPACQGIMVRHHFLIKESIPEN